MSDEHKCSATSTPHKDEHQHHGTKTSPVLAPGTHGGDDHSHDHDEKHCDKEGHDHAKAHTHARQGHAAHPDNHKEDHH
ncbi:unnamed protein product, partial [Mesorhabditis spiculigera]